MLPTFLFSCSALSTNARYIPLLKLVLPLAVLPEGVEGVAGLKFDDAAAAAAAIVSPAAPSFSPSEPVLLSEATLLFFLFRDDG